jgi:hypothetical protein
LRSAKNAGFVFLRGKSLYCAGPLGWQFKSSIIALTQPLLFSQLQDAEKTDFF